MAQLVDFIVSIRKNMNNFNNSHSEPSFQASNIVSNYVNLKWKWDRSNKQMKHKMTTKLHNETFESQERGERVSERERERRAKYLCSPSYNLHIWQTS